MLAFDHFHDYVFRDHPAMDIERRYTQTHHIFVVLVPKLLKYVFAVFPKDGELDFDTLSFNDTISLGVWTSTVAQIVSFTVPLNY